MNRIPYFILRGLPTLRIPTGGAAGVGGGGKGGGVR